jgi:L-ascorbate metabolism protein UlaG (beta-lactamase superfamily)
MTSPDTPAAPRASTLTFVGTATTLLQLGGFTVLTDPNFLHRGERAHLGYGLTSRRLTEPAITTDGLPRLDAVVLSHLHGDHFDRRARAGLPRTVPIVTTHHAARRLQRWGFDAATALDTWAARSFERADETLRITAVPARHGPALVHRALPPTMGTILELEHAGRVELRLYVTGDTVFRPILRKVHERHPEIDVMVTHLGGTKIGPVLVTMDARQGADLVELIRPGTTVPIHYDDYGVFRSPLSHFQHEMRQRGLDGGLRVVLRGDTVPLDGEGGRPTGKSRADEITDPAASRPAGR